MHIQVRGELKKAATVLLLIPSAPPFNLWDAGWQNSNISARYRPVCDRSARPRPERAVPRRFSSTIDYPFHYPPIVRRGPSEGDGILAKHVVVAVSVGRRRSQPPWRCCGPARFRSACFCWLPLPTEAFHQPEFFLGLNRAGGPPFRSCPVSEANIRGIVSLPMVPRWRSSATARRRWTFGPIECCGRTDPEGFLRGPRPRLGPPSVHLAEDAGIARPSRRWFMVGESCITPRRWETANRLPGCHSLGRTAFQTYTARPLPHPAAPRPRAPVYVFSAGPFCRISRIACLPTIPASQLNGENTLTVRRANVGMSYHDAAWREDQRSLTEARCHSRFHLA